MSDIKLTKAQREWLELLARPSVSDHERDAYHAYMPPQILCGYGLATCKKVSFARHRYTITTAGRAWLAANQRRKK